MAAVYQLLYQLPGLGTQHLLQLLLGAAIGHQQHRALAQRQAAPAGLQLFKGLGGFLQQHGWGRGVRQAPIARYMNDRGVKKP